MEKNIYFDDIGLRSTVDVTDPCYSKDVWCRINDLPVLPGVYECYYSTAEGRIAECMIVHEAHEIPLDWEYVGEIGVDAGCAGFFENKPDYEKDDDWLAFCKMTENKDYFAGSDYFLTSSGWGDGGYDVYGKKDPTTNRYVALKIVFIEENDMDEVDF